MVESTKQKFTSFEGNMPKTPQETLAMCKALKEEGNNFYKQKEFKNAISRYSKCGLFAKPLLESATSSGQMDEESDFTMNMLSQRADGADKTGKLTATEMQELKDIACA